MTFGQAIYQAEQGRRIYRKGWNGKGTDAVGRLASTTASHSRRWVRRLKAWRALTTGCCAQS